MPKLLILGGYGNTGRQVARLLLQETPVELLLAGRNLAKAQRLALELNAEFPGGRVQAQALDAAQTGQLEQIFRRVDFVVVAASTTRYYKTVIDSALKVGIDYLDIQLSEAKLRYLQSLANQIEQSERCFITEAGYHPGLPAVMVRYLAPHFDCLERAVISSAVSLGNNLPVSKETFQEFVAEFLTYKASVYKNGQWQEVNQWQALPKVDFGAGFGRQICAPMFLEELKILPEFYPHLKEVSFNIAETNPLVGQVILPLLLLSLKVAGAKAVVPMANLLEWSYKAIKSPKRGAVVLAETAGHKDGQPLKVSLHISHADGYTLTAIPVVAGLLQYLDGTLRRPGLAMLGHAVDPVRFVNDLERLGAEIKLITESHLKPTQSIVSYSGLIGSGGSVFTFR